MGRNLKGKATKPAQQKRRKKSKLGAGGGSPAPSATSSSSSASTPGHRYCEQCGNSLLLDGVAKAWSVSKKSTGAPSCQICAFVAFRRSQRPCVQCARTGCDHFCEWCGKGFHVKCAKLQNEDVSNTGGFCCHKCEAEQSEDHCTDDEETRRKASDDDVGSRCGRCQLPFSMAGKEVDDVKITTGFKVNQAVLVDNDEVLYNALITEVDTCGERIKIHFTRWSKSFDDWYAMDDEHINESLACDCCNQWFHIGCLPPIKSSGRWKDSTYVCPRCIDDARAFHNGNRSVMKAKAAYLSMSTAISKASKKVSSFQEREVALGIHGSKGQTQEEVTTANASRKGKQIPLEAADYPAKVCEGEKTNKPLVSCAGVGLFDLEPKKKVAAPHSPSNSVIKNGSRGNQSTTSVVAVNAIVCENIMHASPEYTVKVVTEAHSSPSKAAAAKIGASKKSCVGNTTGDKDRREQTVKSEFGDDHLSRYSSCNTVMSLLNSPSASETPVNGAVLSLPMLNTSDNCSSSASSSKPSSAASADFQVYVKMEHQNEPSPLYSTSEVNLSSVQTMQKEISTAFTKPAKMPVNRKAKQTQGSAASRGDLSAFDILREVASQEIDEGDPPLKLKREKRLQVNRGSAVSVHKRARMEAFVNTSTSSGRAVSAGDFHHSTAVEAKQLPQPRERLQINSFVDLHFSIRKEMYLRFCRLEEDGMLTRDSAHVLRSLIYPTSERFQDLKFVYLVNKDLSSIQLTKRLLEAVPYPPTVVKPTATTVALAGPSIRHSLGGKSLANLPISIGMFSAGLNCNSSSTEASRVSLLRPSSSGGSLLRPDTSRSDESSRLAGRTNIAQSPRPSICSGAVPITSTKRPEMLLVEQIAPTHHSVPNQSQPPQQQQQQLLNSR